MTLYASAVVALSLVASCCCADINIFYEYNPEPVLLPNAPQSATRRNAESAPTFSPVPNPIGNGLAPIMQVAPPARGSSSISSSGANDPVDVRISDIIAASVLRFAQNIGKQLQQESSSSSNIKSEVFSPLSLLSALALLALGAKGKSYHELIDLFGNDPELLSQPYKLHEQFGFMLNDLQEEFATNISPKRGEDQWRLSEAQQTIRNMRRSSEFKPTDHSIHVANGLFAQQGYSINRDYKTVITQIYQSELAELDFNRSPAQSRLHINNWVNQHTYGKIPSIIDDEIEKGTNVILISALYFKAFWEYDFFVSATRVDQFYPDGEAGPPINVNMMATGGTFPFYDSQEHGCRIIGLPYKGNMTTMYIIQPNQSTRTKLHDLQQTLDAVSIEGMIASMVRRSALVVFPKMHLTRSINMKKLLKTMGVHDIFKNGVSDLSLIGAGQAADDSVPTGGTTATKRGMAPSLHTVASETKSATSDLPHTDDAVFRFPRNTFADGATDSLKQLEALRSEPTPAASDLFVDDIVHKVDFNVNEQGTEAAAATVTYLKKSGPEVTFRADAPFMLLVRHDPTKLILFYGIINAPPVASPTA